jgi:uncharacterized integral membrane protein
MLSLLKMILAILLLAILVIIGWNNTETVSLMLPLVRNRPFVMPLAVALLYAYLAGLLTFAIVHLFQDLKLRTQISRLRKENRKVSEELHQLRSITLEDLPVSEESGSAGPVVSR